MQNIASQRHGQRRDVAHNAYSECRWLPSLVVHPLNVESERSGHPENVSQTRSCWHARRTNCVKDTSLLESYRKKNRFFNVSPRGWGARKRWNVISGDMIFTGRLPAFRLMILTSGLCLLSASPTASPRLQLELFTRAPHCPTERRCAGDATLQGSWASARSSTQLTQSHQLQ